MENTVNFKRHYLFIDPEEVLSILKSKNKI